MGLSVSMVLLYGDWLIVPYGTQCGLFPTLLGRSRPAQKCAAAHTHRVP